MVIIHRGLEFIGVPSGPGIGWILTIILLTIVVRASIFPLFTKQIRSQRAMQMLQPEMKKIQARYKGKNDTVSRQNMQAETMALYKKHGTSPFASCLPLLVQIPLIGALFRVLAATAGLETGDYPFPNIGGLDKAQSVDINRTQLFGAYMVETFTTAQDLHSQIIIVVMIIIMGGTQFWMMRQLTMKNMPASALEGPQAQMQKTMMYMMPLMIVVTGFFFQVGLLIYMLTSNIFTVGQQVWAINAMPTPGSEAYRKWHAKQQAKYDKYRGQLMEEYEAKENAAVMTDPEAAKEVRLERDRLLREKRIKLGLEEKRKVEDEAAEEAESIRIQPTRKTRAQRKAAQSKGGQQANSEHDADQDADQDEDGLTAEEIERRRAERRAAQRARKAQLRKAKQQERQRRIREQGKRPGDMSN
ncbi:hypothetical protein BM477_00955 [Boudabousia marimammalium]|uniref:Membrane protein insertase YidC n=2 Tax=Boudabousia marimammalium TaxID=156892 RepID=A0A1Q5PT72_9ACTO|nr:hypothetical protein BM477_00955 [Boudabousia marimammalium]